MATSTITDLREAVAFSPALKRKGIKPWAAPLQALNDVASRIEDTYANIEKDGPRRLDEGSVPFYRTFVRPLGRPIVEAMAQRHPGNRPLALVAYLLQYGADATVGACAILLCLSHVVRANPGYAAIVLGAHAQHVIRLTMVAAPLIGAMFV